MEILIAEDSATSRLMLEDALRSMGHTSLVARDGNEAWEIFQREEVSLIISDWVMPGLDGLQLCRQIRSAKRPRYVYFILLTALEGKRNYMEAMEAGVDDFMNKPFDIDQLRARLNVAERIISLQVQVKQLQGILPMCSVCKKIRDKNNQWVPIETYFHQHTEADFSHGYCPDCLKAAMKEVEKL
ncbi:MAG: response regulator transcription factor [Thermodesulfobacteriota bacterium]